MRPFRTACTTALLTLVFAVAAYAQPLPQDEPKPREPAENQQPEARPEGQDKQAPEKQDQAKPEKTDREKADQDRADQDQKAQQEHQKEDQQKAAKDQKGQPAQAQSGRGGHIPDNKFRSNFGRSHTFTINRPTIVNNQPTFQYGGYSFEIVDAWPVGWAYTDSCYIDYIDGEYFLFDLLHPGVRIALVVVM